MRSKNLQRLSIAFGFFMAFLMVSSLFLPALQPDSVRSPVEQEAPTQTPLPIPTFPPPITNFETISFDEDYLHPSGLFAIGVPTGWTPNSPINNVAQAQVNLSNPNAVSVIETYVTRPSVDNPTLDDLNAQFDTGTLSSSWSNYTSWNELSRRQEDDRLLIDFELARTGQDFLARHAAWSDGNWVYVVRVVVPQDARDLLFWILDEMIAELKPQEQFFGTPLGWEGYYDVEDHYILRHPTDWILTDGTVGQPASFVAPDGTLVRVEASSGSIADEDAAIAWVEGLRSGYVVTSVEAISRVGGDGFAVNYTYTTPDGEAQSGQAVLLNGADGMLHSAVALLPEGGVDLSTLQAGSPYENVTTALNTFSVISDLDLPKPEVEDAPETETTEEPESGEDVEATEEPPNETDIEATEESSG